MPNAETNLNPYESPEESDSQSAEAYDDAPTLTEKLFVAAIGITLEMGFTATVVILYFLGGYWALLAVFIGIPLSFLGAMFLLSRGWKEKRHAYLREKRRQIKLARHGG